MFYGRASGLSDLLSVGVCVPATGYADWPDVARRPGSRSTSSDLDRIENSRRVFSPQAVGRKQSGPPRTGTYRL